MGGDVVVNVPHLNLPMSFAPGGHAAVVEQNSVADVTNCVQAIVRTERGSRLYVPKFGIDDQTFRNQPLDLDLIRSQVHDTEPRAALALGQQPDQFDQIVADVLLGVTTGGN